MQLNPKDIDIIQRSLEKALNDSENTYFQSRMNDADFKAEVEAYREALLAIKLTGEDRFSILNRNLTDENRIRAILKEEEAKSLKKEQTKSIKEEPAYAKVVSIDKNKPKTFSILSRQVVMKLKASRGLLAAASLMAFVFIGYWLWQLSNTPKLSPLVLANFEPYPALNIHRGGGDKDITDEALQTYSNKDYKKAIPLLEQGFQLKKDSLFLFYQGVAYLGNGQTEQAQTILKNLQGSDTVPTESVAWYLALAYIQSGQKEQALALLDKLKNTEGKYQQKAVDILGKLK
jgi:tetratricopeptide (TPR) repeat protein